MSTENVEKSKDIFEAHRLAQHAIADLKTAVYLVISASGSRGLRNVDVGQALGIYMGHEGHKGHISRTLLSILADEGIVFQDRNSKRWISKRHAVNERKINLPHE
jgi:membrane-anchored protein YejM (alkaline phosphatase superfamily)